MFLSLYICKTVSWSIVVIYNGRLDEQQKNLIESDAKKYDQTKNPITTDQHRQRLDPTLNTIIRAIDLQSKTLN